MTLADSLNQIATKLLELRQKHGLTQEEICNKLYMSRASYSYYENARRMPDIATLLAIARFYNVSMDWLLSNSTEDTKDNEETLILRDMTELYRHIKSKNISIKQLTNMTKADTDFMEKYKMLSDNDKKELRLLTYYKLRNKQ